MPIAPMFAKKLFLQHKVKFPYYPTIRSLKPSFAGSDSGFKMSRESPDSFKIARVGDTTIHLQSEERFANSTDS